MTGDIPQDLSATRRHLLKQAVRKVLTFKHVNRLAVLAMSSLPAFGWRQRIPVVGREGILNLGEEEVIRMGHTDRCQIAQDLFWNRGKLGSPADRLALNIAVEFARQATVFLDIGAYSGLFALAAGRVNSAIRAYAYEILPENFHVLYSNVLRNNLVRRVEPRLCGISNKTGIMTLPTSAIRGTLPSSISLGWKFDEGVDVPLETIDELHSDVDGPVAIKIDVEGFETEVLEGGRMLLERTRPDIVCEVLRRAPRIRDLEVLMRSFDYFFYHITDVGIVKCKSIEPKKTERDWLFTVRDADELRELGIKIAKCA